MPYLKCAVIIVTAVSELHFVSFINTFLGDVTKDFYPGLSQFADFMRTYSKCSDQAVVCRISDLSKYSPLDFEVGETGYVFVNIYGLSIVFYSSVVIYESEIIRSDKRGYLLLFQYTLVNGPGSASFQPVSHLMALDYTKQHLVSLMEIMTRLIANSYLVDRTV